MAGPSPPHEQGYQAYESPRNGEPKAPQPRRQPSPRDYEAIANQIRAKTLRRKPTLLGMELLRRRGHGEPQNIKEDEQRAIKEVIDKHDPVKQRAERLARRVLRMSATLEAKLDVHGDLTDVRVTEQA